MNDLDRIDRAMLCLLNDDEFGFTSFTSASKPSFDYQITFF